MQMRRIFKLIAQYKLYRAKLEETGSDLPVVEKPKKLKYTVCGFVFPFKVSYMF